MPWELALALDPAARLPVFLQIARAVASDVRRGRLRPGAELPGSRVLSRALGVHRNTVLDAHPAKGTFVSATLPDPSPRRFTAKVAPRAAVAARAGFDLDRHRLELHPPPIPVKGTLLVSGGVPDVRLAPASLLGRAYRRALRAEARDVLDYGDPRGHERLRTALAEMVSAVRGLAAGPGEVLVTRGSQMAIDLIARALIAPGDVVAVEAFGYRPAWEALRLAGARLVPLPVDASGLRVDALEELAARERVRAVYVTPHHQYPTTAVLAPGRRLSLLALAGARRMAIIEDDYDHEFHFDGRPVLPLASADDAGVVLYVGTLSKILAPGLRIGFVVAPAPLIDHLAALRSFVDRQGDRAVERAVAELLEEGDVQRHVRRVRRIYRERRDALAEALREDLGEVLSFELPAGGMALWARVAEGVDVDAWAERALARGVAFYSGKRYAFDGRKRPFVRLGFATLDEKELREAVRRMASSL